MEHSSIDEVKYLEKTNRFSINTKSLQNYKSYATQSLLDVWGAYKIDKYINKICNNFDSKGKEF